MEVPDSRAARALAKGDGSQVLAAPGAVPGGSRTGAQPRVRQDVANGLEMEAGLEGSRENH